MAYAVELIKPREVEPREYPTPEPGAGKVRVHTLDVIVIDTVAHRLELAWKFGATPLSAEGDDLAIAQFQI
jgi:NADPH:quinone reductase-like Zn-dependent oxidoreductase